MKTHAEGFAGALLTIDVDAELRKVAQAQLEGAWQLPVELVRRALRSGARRVDVEIGARALLVRDDGAALDPARLAEMAVVLDPRADSAARHRAFVALESAGELGLLVLAGLAPPRVAVESSGAAPLVLRAGAGGRPRVEAQRDALAGGAGPRLDTHRPRGTVVVVEGLRLDRGRARRSLADACRFASACVAVDGQPLSKGFDDAIAQSSLEGPAPARIALLRSGDVARVWLVLDGVASAHVAVPDLVPFEAAVEVLGLTDSPGASALREHVAPHLGAIADAAVGLVVRLGERMDEHPEADQRRLRTLLLAAARTGRRAADVFATAAFPAVERGQRRWLSLGDIDRLEAAGGGRAMPALAPGQAPESFVAPDGPVLILDTTERSRLSQLLGLRFSPLPRRAEATRVWRGAWHALLRRVRTRLSTRGAPLPDGALSLAERTFLATLRAQLEAGDSVQLCAGAGPVRRVRGARPGWLLPRHNRAVIASVRLATREPAWAYPAALALLEGCSPGARARAAWLKKAESATASS